MPFSVSRYRSEVFRPTLFWFAVFSLCWMTLLLFVGGTTTSIEAGMAFLDWPLSNGSLNPEGWTEQSDQLAEHSHRLIGMKMGLLSLILAGVCWVFEARKIVRNLAFLLVAVIVAQGVLGGLRVLFDQLNTGADTNAVAQIFLVLHATGAQVTLCILVTLVLMLSKSWIEGERSFEGQDSRSLRFWSKAAIVVLFFQLILGAMVRHLKAAAIFGDYFPFLTGTWMGWESIFPARISIYTLVHYFHRVGAIVVTLVLLRFFMKAWAYPFVRKNHGNWIMILAAAITFQIFLGAMVVITLRNPHVATLHTLLGASILAITWALTVCFHRTRLATDS